jgi:hypothetical protein
LEIGAQHGGGRRTDGHHPLAPALVVAHLDALPDPVHVDQFHAQDLGGLQAGIEQEPDQGPVATACLAGRRYRSANGVATSVNPLLPKQGIDAHDPRNRRNPVSARRMEFLGRQKRRPRGSYASFAKI